MEIRKCSYIVMNVYPYLYLMYVLSTTFLIMPMIIFTVYRPMSRQEFVAMRLRRQEFIELVWSTLRSLARFAFQV